MCASRPLVLVCLFGALAATARAAEPAADLGDKPPSYRVELLKDHDPVVRVAAAVALGKIGPAAREAVDALSKALADKEAEVRAEAAVALGAIGPDVAAAVGALAKAFQDKDARVRHNL